MDIINQNSEEYQYAKQKVKKIKGFYIHFAVYIVVNIMIIFGTFTDRPFNSDNFWKFETFMTAVFWGIGLVSHWSRVFSKNLLFNKSWEEKKIQEFMSTKTKNKWE